MLSFITGPEGSGKFSRLIRQAKEILESTDKSIMIMVPEQISFEIERKCHKILGASLSRRVQVLSFTRLSDLIFKTFGGRAGKYANRLAKHMVMELALEEMKDGLGIYEHSVSKEGFSSLMLQTVEELKASGIVPENLQTESLDGKLRKKTDDVAAIYAVYQGMLEQAYCDPSDNLMRAAVLVKMHDFFSDYHIFFHEFIQFSGQQRDMISVMLQQSDISVSICSDEGGRGLFHTAGQTIGRLKQMAFELHEKIKVPEKLEQQIINPEISWIERNILRPVRKHYDGEANSVKVLLSPNMYNEVEEIFSEIWDLVRAGYRFRDIALVTGNLNSYRGVLENALEKYRIPYFMDETVPVKDYALMRCASSLLDAASGYDLPLDILKSGVTEFDITEVSVFENYIYTWNINTAHLKQPFTENPRGFITADRATEQDKNELKLAETIRQRIVAVVDLLKSSSGTALSIGQAIMDALDILQVPQALERQYQELTDQGMLVQAQELGRVWDILVEIIETIEQTAKGYPVDLQLYSRLFQSAVTEYDMGSIPQSADCVLIGDAGRMILDNPKVVFVFGANDGIFPYQPSESGIFSDFDREQLEQAGIELYGDSNAIALEQRLQAYRVLSSPSDLLYVTASQATISQETQQPSEVIVQLKEMFGKQIETETERLGLGHLCRNKETAFMQLAFNFRENNSETAALKQYFSDDNLYGPVLKKLEHHPDSSSFKIKNSENAQCLFGKDMRISPTQAESFYKCPFSFFCRNGMKAYPRKQAQLNPLSIGTVVHHVMEQLLQHQRFSGLGKQEIQNIIGEILDKFLYEYMGGTTYKTAGFIKQYENLKQNLLQLALRIQSEFSVSKFRPISFEMQIGDGGEIKPMTLELSNGGTVRIIGEIDRVDSLEIDGKSYIRVVDYKSGGGKAFSISDLYYGLNMQMLLYLFSLIENGEKLFNSPVPAGVLYMPAGGAEKFQLLSRNDGEEKLERELSKSFRMNGLLLNDMEIIQAMEKMGPGETGKYLPVSMQKEQSEFTEKSLEFLMSEQDLEHIKQFTKSEIINMCERLIQGGVEALPLRGYSGNSDACKYCDYKTVCGRESSQSWRIAESFGKEEFLSRIQEESND